MIRLEQIGPVALLLLDRPDRRNALTPDALGAMVAAAGSLADSGGAGALILAGEGPVFCAGFDLSLCRGAPDGSAMRALLAGLSRAIRTLRALPIPVVVAAHGAAIAGGCALLGAGDVVVTDQGAKLGYPVVRLGISPAVSAPFLRLAVHDGPARERLLDPALITGAEAARIGLAHECVEHAKDVRPRALEIAHALAAKPRGAMAATKAWLSKIEGTHIPHLAERALNVSLSLAGGAEEAARLAELWRKTT